MARDWIDILYDLEAYYPAALGVAGVHDENLRQRLVGWANNAFKEIERVRRWSLSYAITNFTTVQGTATYPIPTGFTTITNVYYVNTTGGAMLLRDYSAMELRRQFGEGALSQQGPPQTFSVLGTNIQLFPVPDFTGPNAGNYTIFVEGYQALTPIIETVGTSPGASTSVTVPAGSYLITRGLSAAGGGSVPNVSIRNGQLGGLPSSTDTHLTTYSAIAANVVTVAIAPLAVTNTQMFFNSTNWLITDFPKVLEFAVCREISSFKREADYQMWETRFQGEMERMSDHDADRLTTLEQMATVSLGQKQPQLRKLDSWLNWEVRGGSL